jgi:hypothetical protein
MTLLQGAADGRTGFDSRASARRHGRRLDSKPHLEPPAAGKRVLRPAGRGWTRATNRRPMTWTASRTACRRSSFSRPRVKLGGSSIARQLRAYLHPLARDDRVGSRTAANYRASGMRGDRLRPPPFARRSPRSSGGCASWTWPATLRSYVGSPSVCFSAACPRRQGFGKLLLDLTRKRRRNGGRAWADVGTGRRQSSPPA